MSQFSSAVGPGAARTACQNHPQTAAVERCAGCAEAFCHNCIVEMQGVKYCGKCKVMGLKAQPMLALARIPCKEATESMSMALGGLAAVFGSIFCLAIPLLLGGIGLEITAMSKCSQARKMIAADPRLTGGEKATIGLVLGIIGCAMAVVVAMLAMLAHAH